MKVNKESIRGKQIMDSARPLLKTISEGIKKPMKFDHGGYYPANTFYVYLETNNPEYLQEHGFGDNPPMQIKADTIYEAIDHIKRNMPEDAEMHSISSYETKKSKGGGIYAIGGMLEHGLMIGDTIIDEYKDYGIIKDKSGDFFVYDPNIGERKKIDGIVYEDIMYNGKMMIDDIDKSYMRRAGFMKHGGDIEKSNLEMIKSNVKAIKHHADELESQLKSNPEIEAWVLAKADRASTALSDITHYLDGKKYALGGLTPGRFYKDNKGIEYKFVGKIDNGPKKGELLFNDGKNNVYKSLDEFNGAPKENKLFGFFEDGGKMELPISKIIDEEIRVYPETVKKLLNFIGEGINDMDVESYIPRMTSTYQNEVTIYFSENAWGGISKEDWNKAGEILDKYIDKNGFESYDINPSRNYIRLDFSYDNYPMGDYENSELDNEEYEIMAKGGKIKNKVLNLKSKLKK